MKYPEIRQRLLLPVPVSMISTRQQGGQSIEYVNITDYKILLDERAGIWTSSVKDFKQIGDSICAVVTIHIHADDGIFSQDGFGDESVNVKGYGSVATNAYAQAFRRACESHGLSRELWKKDSKPNYRPNNAQPPRQNAPTSSGKLSENQSKAIYAISKNKGVGEGNFIDQMFPGTIKGELTGKQASEVIEALNKL